MTFSTLKFGDLSVSKVYERKLLSSLARAVADSRDFVDIQVGGFLGEQGVRVEVAL